MATTVEQFKTIIQNQLAWDLGEFSASRSSKKLQDDFRSIGRLLLSEEEPNTSRTLWMDAYLKNDPSLYFQPGEKFSDRSSLWKAFEKAGYQLTAGKPWNMTSFWIQQAASISEAERENQPKQVAQNLNSFFLVADNAKLKLELLQLMGKTPKLSYLTVDGHCRPGVELWTFKTGGEVLGSPTIANGRVYVGSQDESVYCLDALTGKKLWEFETGGGVTASPTIVNDRVYIGSSDGYLYCLNAETGEKLWAFKTRGGIVSSPTVSGENVYFGSEDKKVYCCDAVTGKKKWTFPTNGAVASSPAIDLKGGRLFIGSDDGNLYCLNLSTGKKLWHVETHGAVTSSPRIAEGKIYFGNYEGTTFGMELPAASALPEGERCWYHKVPGGATQPEVENGRIFARSFSEHAIYCSKSSNGEPLWVSRDAKLGTSSPRVADGRVYFGSLDYHLYCLDEWTGRKLWSFPAGGEIWSPPAVADGRACFGSRDGNVYCISY